MEFYHNKKVLVTGGSGFVGSHVVEQLIKRGARVRITTSRSNLDKKTRFFLNQVIDQIEIVNADLRNLDEAVKAIDGCQFVINAAAKVSGLSYNRDHSAEMFRDNMLIGLNTIEAARLVDVERFLVVSSACVYRRDCLIPTPETEGFVEEPEETSRGYGWSKRMHEYLGRAYTKDYGMTIGIARPYNCYGPRDDFDPAHSHVIPGMIKRFADGENPFKLWGNGEQSRSFLFVKDFARGLLEVLEKYAVADPLNIGADEETRIGPLANQIRRLMGLEEVPIVLDLDKPIGQPRRHCDISKAVEKINWQPEYNLEQGLQETIEYYLKNRALIERGEA